MSNQPAQKKPTAAYIFSLLGGLFGVVLSLFGLAGSSLDGVSPLSTVGLVVWMLIASILIIVFADKLNKNPLEHSKWGALIVVFSILSILGLFAFIGGILALIFKPNSVSQSYAQGPFPPQTYGPPPPQYYPQQQQAPAQFENCKQTQPNRAQLLLFKAQNLLSGNQNVEAAKSFAAAYSESLKIKDLQTADQALSQYVLLARTIVFRSALGNESSDTINRISNVQQNLWVSIRHSEQARYNQNYLLKKINELDRLIEKVKVHNLDTIINVALEDEELQTAFSKALGEKGEITIPELASRLSFNLQMATKFLSMGTEMKKFNGYFSKDGQKYVSRSLVRKKLSDLLKP